MNWYLCSSISFILALIIAKPCIAALRFLNSIQKFREQGPRSHIETKSGTPTMGGWIFLLPIFVVLGMIYFDTQSSSVILVAIAIGVGALIGAIDDILKILKSNYNGLNSIQKLIVQFIASSFIAYYSQRYLFADINTSLPQWMGPGLIAWEFIWAFAVIAGSSNAINLSDGLDGLATTLSILAFGGLGIYLWIQGDYVLVLVIATIVAALIGFLIFNFYPAKVFMGDTGSLALGMGLGAIAYLAKLEWHLLIFAIIPVIETISVILQVLSAKLSRKYLGKDIRIFKMAPLHHHFELCGMHEVMVLFFFAVAQILVSAIYLWLTIPGLSQEASTALKYSPL